MRRSGALAALTAGALVLAACGSSGSGASSKSSSSTAGSSSSGGSTTPAASGPATGSPVTIAYLQAESGANADPQVDQAYKMAASEINAHGGIGGHVLQMQAFDVPDFAPNTAINAVNKAISGHPIAIIGGAITDQVLAVSRLIQSAQIPLIHFSISSSEDLGKLHNSYFFRAIPRDDYMAQAAADYMTKTLHLTKLGALNTSDAGSTEGISDFISEVPKSDSAAKVTVHQSFDPSVTDLTPQILAVKGTQGWFSWGFPQTHALELKERAQNGITIPTVLDYGGDDLIYLNLVQAAQLNNVSFTAVCAAGVSTRPQAQTFVSTFKAANKLAPIGFFPATAYDAVYLVQAGFQQSGEKTVTPAAVQKGLTHVKYSGVCTDYSADSNQNLAHTVQIVGLDNAQLSLKQTYNSLTGINK